MTNICLKIFPLSGFLLFAMMQVHANQAPILAGGVLGYSDPSDPDYFLGDFLSIVTYQNDQWTYTLDHNLAPADYYTYAYPTPSAINCHENICAAAGYYSSSVSYEIPLLAFSQDQGQTWEYMIESGKNLPEDFNYAGDRGRLMDVQCINEGCFAIGGYSSTSVNAQLPIVFHNTNEELLWDYFTPLPDDASHTGYNQFNKMSCINNDCVFVGSYNTQLPMILTKKEENWTFSLDSQNLPKDFATAVSLPAVSCAANICVAAGSYVNQANAGNYQRTHLLAVSYDGGSQWEYEYIFDPDINGHFGSVSCTDTVCVIAGQIQTPEYVALIVTGNIINENEIIWNTTYISKDPNIRHFDQVSCSEHICLATGSLETGLLLLSSIDQGKTWDIVVDPTTRLPSDDLYATTEFNSVNCDELTCIATGAYNGGFPLLLMTQDGGKNWNYEIDSQKNLPSNMDTYYPGHGLTAVGDSQ